MPPKATPPKGISSSKAIKPQNPKVSQLFGQILRQGKQLEKLGGQVPKQSVSLLGRALDTIQRPVRGIIGGMRGANQAIYQGGQKGGLGGIIAAAPKALGADVTGMGKGLWGTDKSSGSDLFGDLAKQHPNNPVLKNRLVRGVGGFGLDVAFDPFTYLSGGISKAAPAFEGAAEAGKAVQAAQEAKGVVRGGRQALEFEQGLKDTAKATQATHAAANRGSLQLKFLGKPLASSTGGYEALAKVGRPVAETQVAKTANLTFRNAARYPGQLKGIIATRKAAGVAEFLDFNKVMMKQYGKLTPEEATHAARSLEAGRDLTGTLSKHGNIDLGQFQRDFLEHNARFNDMEKSVGISGVHHNDPTHIPKFFPEAEKSTDAYKAYLKMDRAAQAGSRALPTLDEVKALGLHPHENGLDVIRLRAADASRTVSRSSALNHMLDQFGTVLKGAGKARAVRTLEGEGLTPVEQKYLHGTKYFGTRVHAPPEVNQAIKHLHTFYDSAEETKRWLKMTDQITRVWKTGVTTVNPSHHIRNMIGDSYLNYLAAGTSGGLSTPMDYARGLKVLKGATTGGKMKVGNVSETWDELFKLYKDTGGKSGFSNVDLIGATTPGGFGSGASRGLNRALEGTRDVVSKREDFMRLANWTNGLRQYAKDHGVNDFTDLRKAAEYATERVKKFNFDYSDLTPFESKAIRRVVPFYTYMRKNMPLQAEMLAMHPGLISNVPKSINALQQILGSDSGHLPISEVIPSYLKDIASVRVRGEKGNQNAVYIDPHLPLSDPGQMFSGSFGDVLRKQIGQTAVGRVLYELASGTSSLSGAPISRNIPRYIANQFPISRALLSKFHPTKPTRIIRPGENLGNQTIKLLDIINPVGVKEITQQTQLSELRKRQDPIQARLRAARAQRANAGKKQSVSIKLAKRK